MVCVMILIESTHIHSAGVDFNHNILAEIRYCWELWYQIVLDN